MGQIVLTLIVRNEAPTIALTLASARAALGPGPTVIVDTGSDDGTPDAILAWATGKPERGSVHIYQRPFDNFAASRNRALELAFKEGSTAMMVDASVIVKGTYVEGDGPANVTMRMGSLQWSRPQIFVPGWHYVGKVHEYAEGPGRLRDSGLTFSYELKDAARPQRWARDLALLEDDFSPRGRFYYAQTLDCLKRKSQAYQAYLARAEMTEGYFDERVMSFIRAIPLAPKLEDAERCAQAALQLDGSRGEAYLELARYAEREKRWGLVRLWANQALVNVPRTGALFIDADRDWRAQEMIGDAHSSEGNFQQALSWWRFALATGGERIPDDDRKVLELSIAGCARELGAP